jgi:NTE family protein
MTTHENTIVPRMTTALVLPGGGALGAYEAGVARYLAEELPRELGGEARIDLLCGTSVGAFHACALAAYADRPGTGTARLADWWSALRIDRILPVDLSHLLGGLCSARTAGKATTRSGGLFDTRGLERLLGQVPFEQIARHLREGRLRGVTVSTTHVASGHTVVFAQCAGPIPKRLPDRTVAIRPATLAPEHALASAAIPLLFPAIRIDGELYCEGGLRQNVPLAPALHLGADRIIAVSAHHLDDADATTAQARERAFQGPLYLAGKMLNALLLDRIDNDLERLEQINGILAEVRERSEPRSGAATNEPLRRVHTAVIRASQPLGRLGAEFVRSPAFRTQGAAARALRAIAHLEGDLDSDLLAYLLFDGEFAGRLIEIGRADARRQRAELCALFGAAGPREAAALRG